MRNQRRDYPASIRVSLFAMISLFLHWRIYVELDFWDTQIQSPMYVYLVPSAAVTYRCKDEK